MEVPPELWLRDFLDLADYPPDSPASNDTISRLLAFLATYGPIEPPARLVRYSGALTRELADDGDSGIVSASVADLGLSAEQVRGHLDEVDAVIVEWDTQWHHDSGPVIDVQMPWWMRPREASGQVRVSRTSIGLQVEVISLYRAVFTSWLYLAGHMPLTASFLADDVTDEVAEIWDREGLPVPQTNLSLAETCLAVVNAMVADFGPRVQLIRQDDRLPLGTSYPRIRTLLGLQVLEWLSSGDSVRRCENATCGRYFIRQQGRSQHGSTHAQGVKYCSADCSRAQASRRWRQRNRRTASAAD